jgi:hypothetical protein
VVHSGMNEGMLLMMIMLQQLWLLKSGEKRCDG